MWPKVLLRETFSKSFSVLIILFLVLGLSYIDLGEFGAIDLLQYWSSAKLLAAGQNPYDAARITELEIATFPGKHIPVLMWNPPLVLPFILPLAVLKFKKAVAIWLVVAIISIVMASRLALALYDNAEHQGDTRLRLKKLIFLFSFYPFALSLSYGQISHVILLAMCIFLVQIARQGDVTNNLSAGLALSLTLIKPHLLYLLYIYLFILSVRRRSFKTLYGFIIGAVLLCVFPLLFELKIYNFFFNSFHTPPIYWQTPTLGSWLQALTDWHTVYIRFTPTIIFAIIFSLYFIKIKINRLDQRFILLIVPLSLVSSPYGWQYDQMLLVPGTLWLLSTCADIYYAKNPRICNLFFSAVLFSNIAMIVFPKELGQQYMVWYPILSAALVYTLLHRIQSTASIQA